MDPAGFPERRTARELQPAAARLTAGRIQRAFRSAAKDGDGKLTGDEYSLPENSNRIDSNHDGFLTLGEVRTALQSRDGGTHIERDAPAPSRTESENSQ